MFRGSYPPHRTSSVLFAWCPAVCGSPDPVSVLFVAAAARCLIAARMASPYVSGPLDGSLCRFIQLSNTSSSQSFILLFT